MNNNYKKLPELRTNNRDREYKQFSIELIAKVIYEHLFNNKTHRWLDEHVLLVGKTNNGRFSANILYFLGMKAEFRGIFEGLFFDEGIQILKNNGEQYYKIAEILEDNKKDILFKYKIDEQNSSVVNELPADYNGSRLEGGKKLYFSNKYERSATNREEAIKIHGVNCFGCGFNFESVYGERGKGFIEVHHQNPLYILKEEITINPATDLIPLCSNCHRMVHREKYNVLTLEELKNIISKKNK